MIMLVENRRWLFLADALFAVALAGIIFGAVALAAYSVGDFVQPVKPRVAVTTFSECASAGYPVMESYPRQCRDANGQLFVEDIGNELAKDDIIRASSPRPNDVIQSPLQVRGEARGPWYFEATFPVVLTDWDGLIIAEGYASALGEWMTEDFVPFSATLIFTRPAYGNTGALILRKSNASGLSEHDDALEIPIRFPDN